MNRDMRSERKLNHYLKMQRKDFQREFGRDPRSGEPVFFDPEASAPVALTEERINRDILDGMRGMGFPKHHIYAFEKTGLILSEDNNNVMPPADVAAYMTAVDEYFVLHPDDDEE